MKELQLEFGMNVKRLRKERGYSQNEFAIVAGLTQAYLSRVERGLANPQLDIINKIANGLGISIEELLHFEMEAGTARKLHAEEKIERLLLALQALPKDTVINIYDTLAVHFKRK